MNYVTMNAFEMNYFRMLSDVAFANMSGREMEGGREERGSERRRRRREEEEEVFGRERGVDVSKRLYQHGEFSALSIVCKSIFVSKVSLLLQSQKRIGGNLTGWQPNLNSSIPHPSLPHPSLSNYSSLFPFSRFSLFRMEKEYILLQYLATYYAMEVFLIIPMPSLAVRKSLETALNWLQDEGVKLRGSEKREKGRREREEQSSSSLPLLSLPTLSLSATKE